MPDRPQDRCYARIVAPRSNQNQTSQAPLPEQPPDLVYAVATARCLDVLLIVQRRRAKACRLLALSSTHTNADALRGPLGASGDVPFDKIDQSWLGNRPHGPVDHFTILEHDQSGDPLYLVLNR